PQPALQPKPAPHPQPAPQPKPQAPKPPKAPMSKKAKVWIWITVAVVVVAGALVGGYFYMRNATTYLRISPTQVTIGKDGGTATVAIDYDGYIWDVDVSPEWTETEKDGDVLKITVAPNASNSSRAGAISLKSGDYVASVQLSQSAYVTFITPSVKSLKFGRAAESKTFVISTDGTNATFTTPDFITCERRGDTVTVKAAANSGDSRDGFIMIREDNISAEILVEQLGACAACHGEGKIVCASCSGTGIFRYGRTKVSCAGCNGTGKRDCPECNGAGEI
ncbi:MAG: BACON domain-containing carbohydrate-binding protein, partial [Bacteroidales bacterium]|nr:BACON domain-containing carbohydrate-binding protein [Bacteroidales bacterium]